MILYEFEGKKLLKESGVNIPQGQVVSSHSESINLSGPLVLKAQVLSGKRADVGGILMAEGSDEVKSKLEELLGKTINKEKVEKVLVEEKLNFEEEFYLSISYDTDFRSPVLSVSKEGGTGIEEREVERSPINPLDKTFDLKAEIPRDLVEKFVGLFFAQDCLLLEINPLVKDKTQGWMALDAKIKLDDDAKSRHEDWDFAPRGVPGYTPSEAEIEAKKIDQGDYRGVAGSTYFDLDGDIAVLSSGGGVSLTALDSLIKYGGKPANYTEYSGNPPKEKVIKLTQVVMNKDNLHGLWVIGTVVANFTDIYETLSGILDGLREAEKKLGKKFDLPIVIRRGGPNQEKAFEMLREVKDFNLILQSEETSIAQSAKIMVEEAKKYVSTT